MSTSETPQHAAPAKQVAPASLRIPPAVETFLVTTGAFATNLSALGRPGEVLPSGRGLASSRAAMIPRMQQTVGNRAVQRMISRLPATTVGNQWLATDEALLPIRNRADDADLLVQRQTALVPPDLAGALNKAGVPDPEALPKPPATNGSKAVEAAKTAPSPIPPGDIAVTAQEPPTPKPNLKVGAGPVAPGSAPAAPLAVAPPVKATAAVPVAEPSCKLFETVKGTTDFSTWTLDDILSGGRMALEFTRIIPGWGALTGLAADVTGAYQDMKAIPTGSFPLTEALILTRSIVNAANNVVGHLKYVTELCQDGLAGSAVFAAFIPVSATAIELEALVKVYLDAVLFMLDAGVELGALYNQSLADPKSQEFKDWQGLIDGYQANLIGDVVGTVLDVIALSSAGAANTGAIKQVTAMFPLGRLLIKNLGPIAIQFAQSFFNVYGSCFTQNAVQGPSTSPAPNGGSSTGAPANAIGLPTIARSGSGNRMAEAAAARVAAALVTSETSKARIAWTVVDTGITQMEAAANERLAEFDVVIKKLSGGKGLFEVIRDGSLQAIGTMRARVDQISDFEAMAASGRSAAEDVRGKADTALAKIDAFIVPEVTIPDVELGDGVLADLAESVASEVSGVANAALRATVGKVNEAVETTKAEIRPPVETTRDKATEFIDFLVIAEKFSLQQKATISTYADNLEKGMKKATGFESGVDVLIEQFTTLMGLPSFKIQDIRDEWAAIPSHFDRLDGLAADLQAHAARLEQEEEKQAAPVLAAAAPPEKP
jgi:hypothetical protein